MEIKLRNRNPYWVYFRYPTKASGQRGVECIVKQDKEELARASVFCHTTDRFVKETGRIKAIEKIVEILAFTREEKKEFFNGYFSKNNSVKLEINITKIKNRGEFLQQLTNLIKTYES